jgi:hypothetical protein
MADCIEDLRLAVETALQRLLNRLRGLPRSA